MTGIELIAVERQRQQAVEGWSEYHAAAYLVCATQLNERLRAALVSRSSDEDCHLGALLDEARRAGF